MPPTPKVVLEIDDNSPDDAPSFTSEPSMWSFANDLNHSTRTAAETFREMHRVVGGSVFRGYPKRASQATIELFDRFAEANEVTWLSAQELSSGRPWLPTGETPVERSMRILFEAVDIAAGYFGPDRVRLVFAFI
jgi:hypothetical protein